MRCRDKTELASQPYSGIRILESSSTLAGRLTGLLFADQGAEVYALDRQKATEEGLDDYLDRGKRLLNERALAKVENPDILIRDGAGDIQRASWQIALCIVSVVPGDDDCDLTPEASDDLLNGMVGFYTDLARAGQLLGREVIYTPLPLCSVYAAVLGAAAVASALVDRERCGCGSTVTISRLAAGLSAIGALAIDVQGVDSYLVPPGPQSMPPDLMKEIPKARASESHMVWLLNRVSPANGLYRCADDRLMMPVARVNRRLAIRMFEVLGLWDRVRQLGIVDASPYDPACRKVVDRNIALLQGMKPDLNIQLAELMEQAFATKSATQWEELFSAAQVPCVIVQTFSQWMQCAWARESGLVTQIAGLRQPQLGRAVRIASAKPYPGLVAGRRYDAAPSRAAPPLPSAGIRAPKPLTGYTVVDLSNVISGPACGRLLAELGATVCKVDTARPDHQPLVTVIWAAEANQGKRSLLLDLHAGPARQVLYRLVEKADLVVMNATDSALVHLGLDPEQLRKLNPRAIGVQISAFKGEHPASHDDHPGYDPALQAATGIMCRFGTPDMPLMHGIASCVDYLTGYLGAFAAISALQARERGADKRGDWIDASLAAGAALVQLLFQWGPEAETARGPKAVGPTTGARLYQLSDGWIFAQGSADLSADLTGLSTREAFEALRARNIDAAPVRSIAQLKQRYRENPSATIRFRTCGQEGLRATVFEPTWFLFDGQPLAPPSDPPRPGADGLALLKEIGHEPETITWMHDHQIVGETDWRHLAGVDTGAPIDIIDNS